MVLTGRIDRGIGQAARIDAFDTPIDQWTIVDHVPAAELDNTSRRFAFFVSGRMGDTTIQDPNLQRFLRMEVTLAEMEADGTLRPIPRFVQSISMRDVRLAAGNFPGSVGVPFSALLLLDAGATSTLNVSNTLPAGSTIALVARIASNTGPIGLPASFSVADWTIVTWDLEALGASNYFHHDRVFTGGITLGGGTVTLDNTGPVIAEDPDETWLLFWDIEYQASRDGPAVFFVELDPTSGNQEIRLTGSQGSYGMEGHLDFETHHLGGFRTHVPTEDVQLRLRAADKVAAGSLNNEWNSWRMFAVKLSALYDPHFLQDDRIAQKSTDFGDLTRFVPFEYQVEHASNYITLVHAVIASPFNGRLRYHTQALRGGPQDDCVMAVANTDAREGIAQTVSSQTGIGRNTNLGRKQVYHWALQGQNYTPPNLDLFDFTAVSFGFENDPSNIPDPSTTVVSRILIRPDRESLEPELLLDPPRPVTTWETERRERARHTFESDVGYRWRLPKFARARSRHVALWTGMTWQERVALMDFLRRNRAFRETPPHFDAPIALHVVGIPQPTRDEASGLFQLEVEVLELVHTGANA